VVKERKEQNIMASYNLDAIKAALSKNDKTSTTGKGALQKQAYWKPTLGEHDLRFLPIQNSANEPFQTVAYYGEPLTDNRLVAPYAFGLPDPIKEQFEELRNSKKHPDGWTIAKNLRAKERFYAVIIVRGEEDKGPQIWEFSKETRDQVYGILTHKDNIDEDMLSPDVGYDFTCSVTQVIEGGKPRLFKGSPVKQINLQARKKPSPLSKDKAQAKKWLDTTPNLEEMFKKQCKSPEELVEVLENFVANLTGGPVTASSRESGTDLTESRTGKVIANPAADKLDDAFADL
jgi:hypothetical protein